MRYKTVHCVSLREKMSPVNKHKKKKKKAKIMGIVVSLPCSFGELLLPKTVWFWGAGSECFAPRPQEMVTWPRPGQSWYPIPPAHLESPWEGHVIKQDGPARPRYHMSLLRERQAPSAPLGIKPRRSRAEAVHSSGRRTQVCCWSRKE